MENFCIISYDFFCMISYYYKILKFCKTVICFLEYIFIKARFLLEAKKRKMNKTEKGTSRKKQLIIN